jgi:hypothetical protein
VDEEELGAEDDDDLDQFNIDTPAANSRKSGKRDALSNIPPLFMNLSSESSGTESTARAEPPFLHGKIPAVSGRTSWPS